MSIINYLLGTRKKSASVAKDRLQIILAHERATLDGRSPDYLPALQRELMEVISKYVKVSDEDIKVSLDHQDDLDILEVNITIPPTARN